MFKFTPDLAPLSERELSQKSAIDLLLTINALPITLMTLFTLNPALIIGATIAGAKSVREFDRTRQELRRRQNKLDNR